MSIPSSIFRHQPHETNVQSLVLLVPVYSLIQKRDAAFQESGVDILVELVLFLVLAGFCSMRAEMVRQCAPGSAIKDPAASQPLRALRSMVDAGSVLGRLRERDTDTGVKLRGPRLELREYGYNDMLTDRLETRP